MSLPFCTPAAFVTPTGLSGYRFEVIDMDRNRVDKLLITQVEASQGMGHEIIRQQLQQRAKRFPAMKSWAARLAR